jgi:hypothetical protein
MSHFPDLVGKFSKYCGSWAMGAESSSRPGSAGRNAGSDGGKSGLINRYCRLRAERSAPCGLRAGLACSAVHAALLIGTRGTGSRRAFRRARFAAWEAGGLALILLWRSTCTAHIRVGSPAARRTIDRRARLAARQAGRARLRHATRSGRILIDGLSLHRRLRRRGLRLSRQSDHRRDCASDGKCYKF